MIGLLFYCCEDDDESAVEFIQFFNVAFMVSFFGGVVVIF